MSETVKELIEFSELWWNSAQEGEPIAEDEIELVKDLIAALKSQDLEIKKLSTCQDCGGTGTNELCHDPYYVVPCACTVDWMSENMELRKKLEGYKAITELAVKGFKEIQSIPMASNPTREFLMQNIVEIAKEVENTLSEIERLQNE